MSDWLHDLRQWKDESVAELKAKAGREGLDGRASPQNLKSMQAQVLALADEVDIETALNQFLVEILREHPYISSLSLVRAVRSQNCGSVGDIPEPSPWSGPVERMLLVDCPGPNEDHYISRVAWRLEAFYKDPDLRGTRINIETSVSPEGVQINGQPVPSPTAESFKNLFLKVFQTSIPLEPAGRKRARRHGPRRWYKRLWRTIVPRHLTPLHFWAGMVVIVLTLLIAALIGNLVANSLLSALLGGGS